MKIKNTMKVRLSKKSKLGVGNVDVVLMPVFLSVCVAVSIILSSALTDGMVTTGVLVVVSVGWY